MERAEPGSTYLRRVPPTRRGGFAAGPLRVGGVCIVTDVREQVFEIDGKLQIRNLSTDTTELDLDELFTQVGEVLDARIVRDGSSGMSKGYGFVTMSALSEADAAVSRLNGRVLRGLAFIVRLARARTVRGGAGAAIDDKAGRARKVISISSTIVIYRPAGVVFDFISSAANDFEWQYGTLASAPLSDAALGPGATFQTIGHLMGRRVSGTFEITHYEAGKSYGFRSLSGPMQIVTLFTLEMESGATRVRVKTDASAVNWLDSNERVMGKYMQKQMRDDLAMLRDILEIKKAKPAPVL